ncbi:substrate-binding domain-containing protein [Telmatospirillum sp.]|uniref:substrate-binding domain-containing protein n=1 Tax=Telmatospirillum sp. TaxID=2079197 RepID=UPI0028449F6F|nr:substrate-binding domain-containing protein [Telmatospirillum sp.]MDR3441204.1 substrate-binding domain-containing protein [Telmatospirillum sp.]
MKRLFGLLVLLAFVAMAPVAMATDGKTILYGGGGEGRVTFDGQLHASKGYVCNDCHLKLFTTQKKGLITREDHKTDTLCFACHNGQVAFKTCAGCHRDLSEAAVSVKPASATGPATAPAAKDTPVTLTYEGATTIGTKILPEASKLFTERFGVAFGTIGGAGASAGLKAVVEGKALIGGLASEPTEQQKGQVAAMEVIGFDVMGVFVNPKNPVHALTKADLKEIFAGRAINWKQFGGPDQKITVYSETLTGGRATVKAFQDMVLGTEKYGPLQERDDATDCIEDIAKDESGIAASSMSFATPHVQAISIDGAQPNRAAVQSGAYPLKRPLTLISQQTSGPVKSFFDFMLTKEAQDIVGKNFVPALSQ